MSCKKSKLSVDVIKKILIENYNMILEKVVEIDKGTANIFKIGTNKGKYILKEFNENIAEEVVIKEVKVLEFLKYKKIDVPSYIKTVNDNFYIMHEKRIIIIQKYIEGYTIENNSCSDYEKMIECARIFGKLLVELESYDGLTDENIVEKSFSKKSIQNGIEKMKNLIEDLKEKNEYKNIIKQDLEDKINIAKKLEEKFDFNIINNITIKNTHGDYCIQQLIYGKDGKITVLDFEKAKKMPIIWEVMRSYTYIDKDVENGEINLNNMVEYFKEFYKYIKLNEYDLKYAPHIYLIQLVCSTYGYKDYNNDNSRKDLLEFAFFRTKLCKHLYKNLDKISSELLKIKEI